MGVGMPKHGSVGHTIGAQVIGKDNPPGTSKPSHGTTPGFSNMNVKPSNNGGFSVQHTPTVPGEKASPESPVEEQLHVFRDAEAAHQHIGELMGVRLGSGARRD